MIYDATRYVGSYSTDIPCQNLGENFSRSSSLLHCIPPRNVFLLYFLQSANSSPLVDSSRGSWRQRCSAPVEDYGSAS